MICAQVEDKLIFCIGEILKSGSILGSLEYDNIEDVMPIVAASGTVLSLLSGGQTSEEMNDFAIPHETADRAFSIIKEICVSLRFDGTLYGRLVEGASSSRSSKIKLSDHVSQQDSADISPI